MKSIKEAIKRLRNVLTPTSPNMMNENIGLVTFTLSKESLGYLHGMVRYNNGYYFSKTASEGARIDVRPYVDKSISVMFPEIEWVYPYSLSLKFGDKKKVLVHYMFLGDSEGICYRLKQANRDEQSENIGNGYMVQWERSSI